MSCPNCAAETAADSSFCGRCGRRIALTQREAESLLRAPVGILPIAAINFALAALLLYLAVRLNARAVQGQPDLMLVAALPLGLAAAMVYCGWGLLKRRRGGYLLQLVLAGLGLLCCPLGTLFAAPILIYLRQPGMKILYSGLLPVQLTPIQAQCLELTAAPRRGATLVAVAATLATLLGGPAVIAPLLLPHWSDARLRERQTRTLREIYAIRRVLESHHRQHGHYPAAASMDELAARLVPTFTKRLPLRDGWKHPLAYLPWQESPDAPGPDRYVVASAGRDGRWEKEDVRDYVSGVSEEPDADILADDQGFIRYPADLPLPSSAAP